MNPQIRSFLMTFAVVFALMYFRIMNGSNYTTLSIAGGLGIVLMAYYKKHDVGKSVLMSAAVMAASIFVSYNVAKHVMANYLYIYV